MYRPARSKPAGFTELRAGDEVASVPVHGELPGTVDWLQLWWLPNADPQAPTLLYLHGTFRNLYQNFRKIEALRAAGFGIVAVDYRGWGDSSALVPSEQSIYADAQVAWAELVRRQPDPRKRVIFGHSMGGGVAVELASKRHAGVDYAALILESPFDSGPGVAAAHGALGTIGSWFVTQQFDSASKIARVDAPVLMMHGTADNTVPIAAGRKLRDAAPPGTRWVEFEGGSHSGLDLESPDQYRQTVHSVIEHLR